MRRYLVSVTNFTAGNKTLVFINPGTTRSIEIVAAEVSQSGSTTSAQQRLQFVTQVSAFPTLTAATPVALDAGAGASAITGGTAGAAGTAGVNASSEGAGAKTVLREFGFNVVNGWQWWATKDSIILNASGSSGFGLYLPAAPSSTGNWNASVTFIEY